MVSRAVEWSEAIRHSYLEGLIEGLSLNGSRIALEKWSLFFFI